MIPQYSIHISAARSRTRAPSARLHATKRKGLRGSMRNGSLCALVGLGASMLVAPIEASATPLGLGPFAPGSVVVSQGGTIFGGTNVGTGVELNGDVDVYPPNANGDVAPEASFTNGMYGPTTMAFDPWATCGWPTKIPATSSSSPKPSWPCPTLCRPAARDHLR